MSTTPWRKSSRSATGNCVEVRRNGDEVEVRHSKDPNGPVLSYTPAEWGAFLDGARRGEFDDLAA